MLVELPYKSLIALDNILLTLTLGHVELVRKTGKKLKGIMV